MENEKNNLDNTALYSKDGRKMSINCDCHQPDHQITFEFDAFFPADDDCIYLTTYLNPYQSFWKRLVLGFRYIFKKAPPDCGHFDTVILNRENQKNIIKFLEDAIVKYDDFHKSKKIIKVELNTKK